MGDLANDKPAISAVVATFGDREADRVHGAGCRPASSCPTVRAHGQNLVLAAANALLRQHAGQAPAAATSAAGCYCCTFPKDEKP
ncbi:hypothetical protein ANO11243_007700 [Dothideomycetidae sp. 11243]|nr:hypothetical protein ANO11243_007700 [fungal sp. No.11243]